MRTSTENALKISGSAATQARTLTALQYAAIVSLVFFLITVKSLHVGLPSEAKTALLFNEKTHQKLVPTLRQLRDKIYGQITQDGLILRKNFESIPNDELILHQCRAFLLQTMWFDEAAPIRALQNINPKRLQLNPHFHQYGAMFIYSVGGALQLGSWMGYFPNPRAVEEFLMNPEYTQRLWLVPRLLSAAAIFILALVVFWLIQKISNDEWAVFAAILIASSPAFLMESHYLKPYAMSALFNVLVYYSLFNAWQTGHNKYLNFAAAFSAFSMALLVSNAVFLVLVAGSAFLMRNRFKKPTAALLQCGGVLIIAFVCFNPWWVLKPLEVISELRTTHGEFGEISRETLSPLRWIKYWMFGLPHGSNYFLTLASIAGMIHGTFRKNVLVLVCTASVLILTPHIAQRFYPDHAGFTPHYASPIYPAIVITALYALMVAQRRFPRLAKGYAAIILLYGLCQFTYYWTVLEKFDAIRLQAGSWINENIAHGALIESTRITPFFPPFRLLDYKINMINKTTFGQKTMGGDEPRYYISVDPQGESLLRPFVSAYSPIANFRIKTPFDFVMKNRLYPELSYPIVIYEYKSLENS